MDKRTFRRRLLGFSLVISCLAVGHDLARGGEATAAARGTPAAGHPRMRIDLDGIWNFATDPENAGERQEWFAPGKDLPRMPRPGYAASANGKIRVPGIWDHQGYGTPTEKVYHNFVGKGWYKREVTIPVDWAGRPVLLVLTGVHRYAKVWVDRHYAGQQIGYLSQFETDVTDYVAPGRTATLTIQVDSKQRWEVDTMFGALDLADYMDVAWGGIWGHVYLEARSRVWLSELYVQADVPGSACSASAVLCGKAGLADRARLEVSAPGGRAVAKTESRLPAPLADGQVVRLAATIPEAELWSPDHPALYTARLSILRGDAAVDMVESRFGMRQVEIRGPYVLLNGKRLMLRGYGDDHIFPEQMAMPADKDVYLERLRLIKSYGFNHVRHHSTIMPPEYYDACDEVGMMPTAEFPIAYDSFLPRSQAWKGRVAPGTAPAAAEETYRREWAAAILRHRNHPCIFCWVMGNELWDGVPLRRDFRQIARRLDPGRLFADTDGLFGGILDAAKDRDTLDLYFLMFNVGSNVIDNPTKFRIPQPKKPVVSHEQGNFVTFTRPDVIDRFRHNIKPFWLTSGKEKLAKLGLLEEADHWAEKSERLYLLCHKYDLEALRKNPYISGYHWWLFQDYWTSSNGLVDHYFRPKAISAEEVRRFNNDVVLLQDGLEATCRGASRLGLKLRVSNYSPEPIHQARLTWQVRGNSQSAIVKGQTDVEVGQGELSAAIAAPVDLPDVEEPTGLTLEADLAVGRRHYVNQWPTQLYPAKTKPAPLPVPVFADPLGLKFCRVLGAQPIIEEKSLSDRAVYVIGSLDRRVTAAVQRGACMILLDHGGELLPWRGVTYRTSWWKAGDSMETNLCGTLVYEHPATRAMAPGGWCDDGWFHLVEGGRKFVLEGAPARPAVIVRALPSLAAVEDDAMLFEVGIGSGAMIVSGLNHEAARGRPEGDWLMARLLEHAAGQPHPKATWPASFLPVPEPPPPGPHLPGFQRLSLNEGEDGTWYSYREDNAKTYICRQTVPGNLVQWETAAVPAAGKPSAVTFVFAGGLGYSSQPKTAGFVLLVNGRETARFDLADRATKWCSTDRKVEIRFSPRRHVPQDCLGVFYVVISSDLVKPGEPCRLGVRSLGSGSRRWFGLNPYNDVK